MSQLRAPSEMAGGWAHIYIARAAQHITTTVCEGLRKMTKVMLYLRGRPEQDVEIGTQASGGWAADFEGKEGQIEDDAVEAMAQRNAHHLRQQKAFEHTAKLLPQSPQ